MTLLLIGALVAVVLIDRWLLERKDKRHVHQIERLLLWRHEPKTASLPETKEGAVLYLAPEDDESWNKAHRKAD